MDKAERDELDRMLAEHVKTLKEANATALAGYDSRAKEVIERAEKVEADCSAKIEKAREEAKKAEAERREELKKLLESVQGVDARLLDIEQKGVRSAPSSQLQAPRTFGDVIAESEAWKDFVNDKRQNQSGPMPIGTGLYGPRGYLSTAIVTPTQTVDANPLVPSQRVAGIWTQTGDRQLRIRSLIPSQTTESNLIEFVKETAFDDQAAPQGAGTSPVTPENVVKAESGITFTLAQEKVQTIAHWLPASRQILADSGMLRGHIDQRLLFGLAREEEDQLLLGSGTGVDLNGIQTQAQAYDTGLDVANDTLLDKLRHAVLQVVRDADWMVSGFVLHPTDWQNIELLKVNAGTDDRYLIGDPTGRIARRVWGLPVVESKAQTAGTFLAGAFDIGATIWDREDATVEVFRQHSDFAVRNMVAILAEERIALTVYRDQAFVTGTF